MVCDKAVPYPILYNNTSPSLSAWAPRREGGAGEQKYKVCIGIKQTNSVFKVEPLDIF